jgi:hypothetical protein
VFLVLIAEWTKRLGSDQQRAMLFHCSDVGVGQRATLSRNGGRVLQITGAVPRGKILKEWMDGVVVMAAGLGPG